jgi:hypothetical protein
MAAGAEFIPGQHDTLHPGRKKPQDVAMVPSDRTYESESKGHIEPRFVRDWPFSANDERYNDQEDP